MLASVERNETERKKPSQADICNRPEKLDAARNVTLWREEATRVIDRVEEHTEEDTPTSTVVQPRQHERRTNDPDHVQRERPLPGHPAEEDEREMSERPRDTNGETCG